MNVMRRFAAALLLLLLAACEQPNLTPAPSPAPATAQPSPATGTPAPVIPQGPTPTPTAVPILKPGNMFPTGLTNEPLAVVTTSPADKAADVAVLRDQARIIVQFNHPVVPLVGVEAQKDLPQPLTFQPAVAGKGEWLNTATYAFTPSADLTVAAAYTVSVKPLTDMLGQSLAGHTFTFRTVAPGIAKRSPDDTSIFAGASQPISVTFNTQMDTASVESRFRLLPPQGGGTTGRGVPGRFVWDGALMRFVPDQALEFDTQYTAVLAAGAQDVNKAAETKTEARWTFRTVKKPDVAGTSPRDGATSAREIRNGFTITFTSPMKQDAISVTVQPTITDQFLSWRYNSNDMVLNVYGNWLASRSYTVTVGAESQGRYGDKMGKAAVTRFTAAPRDPELLLNVQGMMGMYDAYGSQLIYASYINLERIEYALYRVDREDFLKLSSRNAFQVFQSYRPPTTNRLREWSQTVRAPVDATRLVSTTLTTGTPLAPGVYFVEARSPSVRNTARHLLVVTDVNLALKRGETEALVWATNLQSGKPVANHPIALYGPDGRVLGQGKTDANGVYRATFARLDTTDPIVAVSESDGRVTAAAGSDWNGGILPWEYQLPMQYTSQEYFTNLYTDRPVYRPGQTVYYRGIVRRDNDTAYSLPTGVTTVTVKVRSDQGKEILTQDAGLDRFGTFDGEIALSEAASIGSYYITLELGAGPRKSAAGVSFVVAEYRRPEFQVDVKTDQSDYVNGDTIRLESKTTYYFGGAVADAKVQWRLLTDDYYFRPQNVKGYWDFVDSDLLLERRRTGGLVREGKGVTDKDGIFRVEVPTDLKEYPLSQNFTLETDVTDINNQSVANRVTVPVHKGRYYIGLKPQRYVGEAGKEQAVDVLTVDPKGNPVPNQTVHVGVYSRTWYNVREKREDGGLYWTSRYSDTLVTKLDVLTSGQGEAVARFTPPAGGIYRIAADATDGSNNVIRSATFVWVTGGRFIPWRLDNNDRIDLISDKKSYNVGETAEILIPAPFVDGEALVTIERGGILEVRRITMQGNSEKLTVPIRSEHVPNVYVSVMLVKGRTGANEPPQFKMGYASLAVATTEKELKLKVTADKAKYGPGEKATFDIEATDVTGKPVEAEFSLALVDKSVQALVEEQSASLLQTFYGQRGLAIQTSASLIRSVERLNQVVERDSKGGGGGGGGPASVPIAQMAPVRRNFRDTAFWSASVATDAQGKARVTATLPDNLTTWNARVKGVTVQTQVGDAAVEVVSTKDLLVRPVTPRFFVAGDRVRLEAVVNNNGDKDVTAEVRLATQGVTVASGAAQNVTVKAKGTAKVGWDGTVGAVESAVTTFSVSGNELTDSVEFTIPVLREASPETVGTAGQVETKVAEQIRIPANADRSAGELVVETSPSLAAASRSGLAYLETYETNCTEFVVSRFFPNAATHLALKKAGIERPDLQKTLENSVGSDIQRLFALQNMDGGWGWCANGESRPTLTAYAYVALLTAQRGGFAVDGNALNRAGQFLQKFLAEPVDARAGYAYNERAFVVFALSEGGGNFTSRAVNLYEQRANLGNYGKALLLLTLQAQKMPQAPAVAAELTAAALQSATGAHWEEAKQDYWTLNSNTRSTALAIMALSRADPKNATLPNAVRWLMTARKAGHWETTQETAWAVLALAEAMQASGELSANYTYSLLLNSKPLGAEVKVAAANVDKPQTLRVPMKDLVQEGANELLITRGAGDGRLYYSAHLKYYLPSENIPGLNRGIIVGRQYYAVDQATLKPKDTPIASAKVGDYVQVRLAIVAPTDLHYLVLEDALPAGFEAVDNSLRTSSVAAQPGKMEPKPTTELKPVVDPFSRPWWLYWTHSEVRDDRVAVYATYLGRGVYEYSYMMRASVAGEFRTLPARAWQTYAPEVMGRSEGAKFQILP